MILPGNDPATQPSFSLGNRVARATWGAVWLLLFRTSPRPAHAWRRALLRLFGARLGAHVHVYPGARIWAPWQLEIGDRVGVGDGATLYNMGPLRIGHDAVVSQGAHLCGGTHDIHSRNFQLVARAIDIGPHAWVCADAFVGPGVRIAPGCVVGARSVVMKSIAEPWTVWAGHPAQRVSTRQTEASP
jgi:putative colanic acid biosynthesis acetyltransferase WcaF